MADRIANLAGHLNEPYRQDQVLAAARGLAQPFIMREITSATGLPPQVCQRVLSRLLKKGIVTRSKLKISYPTVTLAGPYRSGKLRWIEGGRQRHVFGYRLVDQGE